MSILTLAGSLAMFLYGMNMMSTGLQKSAGNGLRRLLGKMTSNPFKGVPAWGLQPSSSRPVRQR